MTTTIPETPLANTLDVDLEKRVKLCLCSQRPELGKLLVRVEAGSVRLAGSVSSFYIRQLALAVACRVAGVRRIVDEIEVPTPIRTEGTTRSAPSLCLQNVVNCDR